ncbi:hypothetical protein JCM30760_07790 [Thiomicrorhabdus hydrogeniphila]
MELQVLTEIQFKELLESLISFFGVFIFAILVIGCLVKEVLLDVYFDYVRPKFFTDARFKSDDVVYVGDDENSVHLNALKIIHSKGNYK